MTPRQFISEAMLVGGFLVLMGAEIVLWNQHLSLPASVIGIGICLLVGGLLIEKGRTR